MFQDKKHELPLILRHALRLGAALTLSVSLAACGSDKV